MVQFLCAAVAMVIIQVCNSWEMCGDKAACDEVSKEPLPAHAMLQVLSRTRNASFRDQPPKERTEGGLTRRQFRKTYSRGGRQPANISLGDVFVDFEVQYGKLRLTPDVLIDSLYSTPFNHKRSCDSNSRLFGSPSRWFSLGTDGASRTRQQLNAQLELTSSRMMRPKEVLESGFLAELQAFVNSTNVDGAYIPGTRGRVRMLKGDPRVLMQYSVGIPLSEVPTLMNNYDSQSTWLRTNEQCGDKPVLYKALVALAAMTLQGVTNRSVTKCLHAKRYLYPWLVRTHFGDLANYVASNIDSDILKALPQDVWAVSQVSPSAQAFPAGVTDYLHMLEVAEVARLTPASPATSNQLCALAKRAVRQKKKVVSAVHKLGCGVYGLNTTGVVKPGVAQEKEYLSSIASPQLWLESILRGRDLWTDEESLASGSSKTNLIFKSMGSWRMPPGGGAGYVYLECVDGDQKGMVKCLGGKSTAVTVSDRMREVSQRLGELQWHSPTA